MEAFGKILVKHDKISNCKVSSVYLSALESVHFNTSNKTSALAERVESWYVEFLAGKDPRKAMIKLLPRKARVSHTVTFFLGLYMGGIIALIAFFFTTIAVTKGYEHPGGPSYIEAIMPVFSVMLLVALHVYMYGINVFCWRAAKINYAFIFEFSPGTELRYRQVFLIASGLTLFVLGGMCAHLAIHSRTHTLNHFSELIPLFTVAIPVILLFAPFDILYYSSRVFFLRTMRHLLLAPLYKVTLPDFFLADQLTSQVPMLRWIQFSVCYYSGAHFLGRNRDVCLNNSTFKMFSIAIAILPFASRFLQCMRRWLEEGGRVHVWNALKYLSAIMAVALRCFHQDTKSGMVPCIVASVWATLFGTWWDFVMDWGLLNPTSKNRWLRDNLALSHKSVYFLAMALNVLLRFAWIDSVVMFSFGGVPRNVTVLIVASLEVCRRGIWNFFRLENEHLNNVGRFRAVRAVPLPFVNDKDE